jgi:hypothetical protein
MGSKEFFFPLSTIPHKNRYFPLMTYKSLKHQNSPKILENNKTKDLTNVKLKGSNI